MSDQWAHYKRVSADKMDPEYERVYCYPWLYEQIMKWTTVRERGANLKNSTKGIGPLLAGAPALGAKGKKKGKRPTRADAAMHAAATQPAAAAPKGPPKGWEAELGCILEWAGAPVRLARAAAARLVAGGCGGPEELQRTQKADLIAAGLGEYEAVFLIMAGHAGTAPAPGPALAPEAEAEPAGGESVGTLPIPES